MNLSRQSRRRLGRILTGLVSAVLILAGLLKLIGFGAEDMLEGLANAGLMDQLHLISLAAIVTGILLAIPRTTNFGVLLASAYWGGAIVAHMTYGDSYVMPAGFLLVTWTGAILQNPRLVES